MLSDTNAPQAAAIVHHPPGSQVARREGAVGRSEQAQDLVPRALADALAGALSGVLRALAPPRCAGCGWFCEHLFCASCAPGVRRVEGWASVCECCGEPFDRLAAIAPGTVCSDCRGPLGEIASPLERARSLWMLRGPVRGAVHGFKYRGHTSVGASFGAHLGVLARGDAVMAGAGLVVPVPLHAWREWKRGFNQSGVLARHLAHEMGLPCASVLRRVRHTPTQTTLSRHARDANVRAAFAVPPSQASRLAKYLQQQPEAPILLVDDVWTTGATLRECARALHKAGARHIVALTLARRGR